MVLCQKSCQWEVKSLFIPKMSNLTLGKDRHGGWSSRPLYYLRKLSTEKGLFIEETSGWWVRYVVWVAVVVPQYRVYWRQRRKLPHNTWQRVADRLWTRLYLLHTVAYDRSVSFGRNLIPSFVSKFNFEQVTDFKESTMSAWEEIVRLQQDLERVQAAGAVQVEIGCT